MIANSNLYNPIMYLIDKAVTRHFGDSMGDYGNGKGEYIEGMRLIRDDKKRLKSVEGWEHLDYNLTYTPKGMLDKVDIIHKVTGKHVQIRLIFDAQNLLIEVEPELMSAGSGDPGYIDVPNVTPDYNDTVDI